MSDKPISVGDLVQVVRPSMCTGNLDGVGHTFSVTKIVADVNLPGPCFYCKKSHPAYDSWAFDGDSWWTLRRLKRIPPLSELEGAKDFNEIVREMQEKLKA